MENGPASCISRILIVYLVGGALLLALARYARGDQVNETLLNNSALTATPLADGDCGEGNIDPAGDIDFWSRADASPGNIVYCYVHTESSSTSTDSLLEIRAADGTTILDDDDNDGPGQGSVVAGLVLDDAGPIFYRVIENGDNARITPYELVQVLAHPADRLPEEEPNGTAATATPIDATVMAGDAAWGDADLDFYSVELSAGQTLVVMVDEDPDNDGELADSQIQLIDTDGVTILESGDNLSGNNANAAALSNVGASGTYYVRISNDAGPGTVYEFATIVDCARSCPDGDGDGICDGADNCPDDANENQADNDGDGSGDECDLCEGDDASGDDDNDFVCDDTDNCPNEANVGQTDDDSDGVGNVCDLCDGDDDSGDSDEDGICDDGDLCVGGDDTGDSDEDGTCDDTDLCQDEPGKTEPGQCGCAIPDTDTDGDGTADCMDECPENPDKTEPNQCGCELEDADADLDGILNCEDNCPTNFNPDQADSDDDAIGDDCDPTPLGDLCGVFGQLFVGMTALMVPLLHLATRKMRRRALLRR